MKKLILAVMVLVLLTGCNSSFARGFVRGYTGIGYKSNQTKLLEALIAQQRYENNQNNYYRQRQDYYNREVINAIQAEEVRRAYRGY